MSGYGNGQGGGGYFPPQGVYPPYNNNSSPPPNFPSPQTNLYPPSNQSTQLYPNTPNSDSSTLPTPHHQQSSSSASSLTPEFPQQATSTTSSPSISQNNSSQFNSNQFNSSQFNSNQFNSNQFNNSGQFSVRVGEAPKVQPRRYKTQHVKLTNGNVVLNCRVPSKLTSSVPLNSDEEFTHVRYTACTCDPDFFQEDGYSLRQRIHNRSTEIFIVITMYNEEAELFARTFYGVVKNIHKLCQRDRSRVWGPNGWQKVVVCVVSDGRSKIDKRTEDYLAAIGVYQKGIAKEKINDKKVSAHIYEYTTQLCLDDKMRPVGEKVGYTPIQVLFCLKEKNQKKINSHRWFFNAFGRVLEPNICILLDAGTKPGGNSIYHLWKAFDTNSNIGGACGEIVAMKGTGGKLLLNPLVAAQNFEYKMSNILDKPLESVFGYITVLPGAFSAYRYVALQNDYDPILKKEVGPLASYFMGEKHHGGGPPKRKKKADPNSEKEEEEEEEEIETGLFTANMYLAEDRILCFELVSKRKSSWVLHYVKSAYAETDVPNDIIELIRQRRRWLNGSFFAGLYAICHTSSIWRSHHTGWKKFVLLIEMFYQTFNLAFSWFALVSFHTDN
jgi:chitin synthase